MAKSQVNPPKIHLYYDQQHPDPEPKDAEHAPVVPALFARRPATPEDRYFFEETRRELEEEKSEQHSRALHKVSAENADALADEPKSLWRRFLQALMLRGDTEWRP